MFNAHTHTALPFVKGSAFCSLSTTFQADDCQRTSTGKLIRVSKCMSYDTAMQGTREREMKEGNFRTLKRITNGEIQAHDFNRFGDL